MTGIRTDLRGECRVILVPTLAASEDAAAVVAVLKALFDQWLEAPQTYDFQHRIEVAGRDWTGLPVPLDALHPDCRAGHALDAVLAGLQPGWFWLETAALPGGEAVVRDWLAFAKAALKEAATRYKDLWEDCEAPLGLGQSAAMTLACHHRDWVADYADLLTHWDLSHEVHEVATIGHLYAPYGWCPDIRALMIARVAADGQHHTRQVFATLRKDLSEQLSPHAFTAFYKDALSAFRDANLSWLAWPPDENACKTFSINGPLVQVAQSLPANTVPK